MPAENLGPVSEETARMGCQRPHTEQTRAAYVNLSRDLPRGTTVAQ